MGKKQDIRIVAEPIMEYRVSKLRGVRGKLRALQPKTSGYTAVEICAGGGGQALGLDRAGFRHLACVEYEPDFCRTLKANRPGWNVVCDDIRQFDGTPYKGCDLLAGGVPCPPFSIAGKQLGADDDRDMFPAALRLIGEIRPRAILLENVKGLAQKKFAGYLDSLVAAIRGMGYRTDYRVLEASDYGVPQLRPRFVLVALAPRDMEHFVWPEKQAKKTTVGEALFDLLAVNGWKGALRAREAANDVAPTLVGGSKRHGGPDLGPTRAKAKWRELGFDGKGIVLDGPNADEPEAFFPRLTIRMAARIQGFPDEWNFCGAKTVQYRQVGNAFPPPVACAVGKQIQAAFKESDHERG